jgi:hypothetical protein
MKNVTMIFISLLFLTACGNSPSVDDFTGCRIISQGAANNSPSADIQCANGTEVTVEEPQPVQFCGSTGVQSYPSTFNESGLCINQKVYAVYSANGGFLTYLPPGAYTSSGIGSSCNFTITTGCIIAPN